MIKVAVTVLLLATLGPASGLAQPGLGEGWIAAKSPSFTVYGNAEPARVAEITASLERFRAVFAQLSPALELQSPAPTKILAFRDAKAYAPYKTSPDRGSSRILGQFLSHPDGNYITLDAGTQLVSSFTVIYHEYVHYFVRHNFPGIPLWFNEGLAEYYSTFATDGESAHVGLPVERHVRWLRRNGELALDQVLATEQSVSGHDGHQVGRFYAVSWALVHYLMSGDSERLDRAIDFLVRLRTGEAAEDAFERAFDVRVGTLEQELASYIAAGELPSASIPLSRLPSAPVKVHELPPEDALFHLGDLLAHMGREHAAEQHFQLALDHWGDHPESHAGLAFVRDLQSRFEEAEWFYQDALRLGSRDPLTYLLFGRHLLARTSGSPLDERNKLASRARVQLDRAVALNADYGEAWALLGRSHLIGSKDPEAGLKATQRARLLMPERADVVDAEARLLLNLERFDEAEALIEDVLAFLAPAEAVEQARSAVARQRLIHASIQAFEREDVESGLAYFDQAISATSDPEQRERMEVQLREMQERWRASGS